MKKTEPILKTIALFLIAVLLWMVGSLSPATRTQRSRSQRRNRYEEPYQLSYE